MAGIVSLVVVLVIAAGAAIAFMGEEDPAVRGGSVSEGEVGPSPSRLPQARWVIRTFASGTAGPPKKAHKRAVAKEKEALSLAVTSVIDAVTLRTAKIGDLAGEHLSGAASKALARSKLTLPDEAQDVQMVKRKAEIGLDANGGKRAAALVTTVVKGTIGGSPFKLSGRARLYMQKRDGGWQVIAFDAERSPHERAKDGKKSGKAKKDDRGKASKKKKGGRG